MHFCRLDCILSTKYGGGEAFLRERTAEQKYKYRKLRLISGNSD
jgi:hypothetical protein